jgi:hypothetical protein
LQQQYSPEKVKLELTDFANQQIPTGTTFEHDEISTIVEKVFAGFITHNQAVPKYHNNAKIPQQFFSKLQNIFLNPQAINFILSFVVIQIEVYFKWNF